MTVGKINPFSAAQTSFKGGISGVQPVERGPQEGGGSAGSTSGSGLVERLNAMDGKSPNISNGYAGKVHGQDNFVARKIDFQA